MSGPRQRGRAVATGAGNLPPAAGVVLAAVLEILESDGYDAVALREVARRARMSLGTVYKWFPTRDDLIVTAIERWMADNCYADLAPPPPGESLADGLMRVFRYLFEPWERSPRMLEAYHRARAAPVGERLDLQGATAIDPVAQAVFGDADPAYVDDISLVLTNMAYALIGRFADGAIDITAILPALERTVFRLTANNEPAATTAAGGRAGARHTQTYNDRDESAQCPAH